MLESSGKNAPKWQLSGFAAPLYHKKRKKANYFAYFYGIFDFFSCVRGLGRGVWG
jgi:hypothetical protein